MKKWDCCHECKVCLLLTTHLPPCTGEHQHEARICDTCAKVKVA